MVVNKTYYIGALKHKGVSEKEAKEIVNKITTKEQLGALKILINSTYGYNESN